MPEFITQEKSLNERPFVMVSHIDALTNPIKLVEEEEEMEEEEEISSSDEFRIDDVSWQDRYQAWKKV